jgi:hypothetical protein
VALVVVALPDVVLDGMLVDGDTPVRAAADQLAYGGAAGAGREVLVAKRNRGGRRGIGFRHEDQVALGVGGHRMRAGRCRDGFDQNAGPIHHTEHRASAERRSGGFDSAASAQVIAAVARIEPDFVRAGDTRDLRVVVGGGVDHKGRGAGRVIARCAAEQQVIMHADGGPIRSTRVERDHPDVRDRVEGTLNSARRVRIGHQQTAAARGAATRRELAEITAHRIVGNYWDGRVEALRLRVPGGLLDTQAKADWQYGGIHESLLDRRHGAWTPNCH